MDEMIAPYRKLYRLVEGRSSRREFWLFLLLALVLHLIPMFLLSSAVGGLGGLDPQAMGRAIAAMGVGALLTMVPLYLILGVTWVAMVAVSIRRLHDAGLTGWIYLALLLANLVPLINLFAWIAYLGLMALPGTPGPNRYGEPPVGEGEAATA
ncbi:MAG: DUF805 domain-containing protein [Erythrobacter sp.]|nr:DUF805 domain-containing protein [Erythrobacter sp.]